MDERLRQTVRERADHRCEYCYLPQNAEPFFAYHVEHIVARQHGGTDDNENLALACYHGNAHKGPNLSGLDPETGALVRLFHPKCFVRNVLQSTPVLAMAQARSASAPKSRQNRIKCSKLLQSTISAVRQQARNRPGYTRNICTRGSCWR
jgi:HNH endonuclease